MDPGLIELVDCRDSAAHVLLHPDIAPEISEDGVTWDDLPAGPIYLTGFVGQTIIGAFVIEKRSRYQAEVHVQVLPEFRARYAEKFGRAVIAWTWENTGLHKMTAQIDTTHPNVLAFAERMGFEVEGVNHRSLMKGGRLVDQFYVGIARE